MLRLPAQQEKRRERKHLKRVDILQHSLHAAAGRARALLR
jgi:hypothetical protein